MCPEDSHSFSTLAVRAVLESAFFGSVANRVQFESVGIEPVGREAVFPVLGKLAWFVQDDGLTRTCPLARFPDDLPTLGQDGTSPV